MKRQAISVTIEELEKMKEEIEESIKNLEEIGIRMSDDEKRKLKFQYNIINYPTKQGRKTIYLSDTWEFE